MLLDTSRFPLVFLREAAIASAEDRPERELERLLDRGEPFIFLTDHMPGDHADESSEERKSKALFFKRNKARMTDLCQGLVLITGDREIATPVRLAAQGVGKAFGLRVAFVRTEDEGVARGSEFMEGRA